MSELKALHIVYATIEYDDRTRDRGNDFDVYDKDEVDKVIRHANYKRCLAMARWCRESLRLMRTYEVTEDFWNLEPGQDAEYFCKKGDFYSKWRKRWLALAEEPTWAKFLQLIHKEGK